MNAAFGYQNALLSGTLAAGSAVAALPVSNLRDNRGSPSMGWQTAAGIVSSAAGAFITLDGGVLNSVTLQAVGLFRTNLSAAAKWRIRLAANVSLASPVLDTGSVSAGVQPGFGQAVFIGATQYTGRFLRIDIDDPTNTDGFINVPLAYAGPVWIPTRNIDSATTFGRTDQTDETVSRGGQEFPQPLYQQRTYSPSLASAKKNEVWPDIMVIDLYARMTGGNLLFIPEPNGADMAREAIFGRLKTTADVSYPQGSSDLRKWTATITERI